jgi:hypothetical protein
LVLGYFGVGGSARSRSTTPPPEAKQERTNQITDAALSEQESGTQLSAQDGRANNNQPPALNPEVGDDTKTRITTEAGTASKIESAQNPGVAENDTAEQLTKLQDALFSGRIDRKTYDQLKADLLATGVRSSSAPGSRAGPADSDLPGGIGVGFEIKGDYPVVTRVLAGGAADKSDRIKVNDRIESVGDGDDGPMVSMKGRPTIEYSAFMSGPIGSTVRLAVHSAGAAEPTTVTLVRAPIEHPRNGNGQFPGLTIPLGKSKKTKFIHVDTVQRFPGSTRFYELIRNQREVEAFPDRYVSKRCAVVTELLFPEIDKDHDFSLVSRIRG